MKVGRGFTFIRVYENFENTWRVFGDVLEKYSFLIQFQGFLGIAKRPDSPL